MSKQIFYHVLEESSLTNGKLYRVKKGTKLRLTSDPKLLNKTLRVFCNLPKEDLDKQIFIRNKFYEYPWIKRATQNKNDIFDDYVEIDFNHAGSFQYYFVVDQNEASLNHAIGGADVIVEPELKFSNGQTIDLNCLQMQTVLTKLLGSLDEWESRLRITKECGYNMIHFSPVEELSRESNSSYSLRDHRKLNEIASSSGKFSFNELEILLNKLYNEWNILSISDLVYNHMSNDAPFLIECPDAAYNMENSMYLRPAFLFDRLLHYLSNDIENGKYESIGIKSSEFTYANMELVRDLLNNHLIPKVKFEEFYTMNVESVLHEMKEKILKSTVVEQYLDLIELWAKLKLVQDPSYGRLKSTVDFEVVSKIVANEYKKFDSQDFEKTILEKFRKHFQFLNDVKKAEIKSWLEKGVENVYLNAKYHFFADDGPKYKRITKSTPLIRLYFRYPFADSTLEQDELDIYDHASTKGKHIMAHNG